MSTISSEPTLSEDELSFIVNMLEGQRALFRRGGSIDPLRNVDEECRYPDVNSLVPQDYRDMYDKFSVAERVVNILPDETWGLNPEIYESEKEDVETEFEAAWKNLNKNLEEESHFIDEESSPIWECLKRVDQLSGIGRFGVVLLGLGIKGEDNSSLEKPLPGFEDDEAGFGYAFNAEKKSSKAELLYLRAFDESLVDVSVYEDNRNSRRYGQPKFYNITLSDPLISHQGIGHDSGREERVHWSRVIHVADNLISSEIYGKPRQQSVFHHLLDLRKLYGGSAEMYWQGAYPGISFETHPQLGNTIKIDASVMKDQVQKYFNGLQRYLALTGATAKPLSPQVVDPTSQIERALDAICIKLGIPKRIFVGSERGELASSQDSDTWGLRLQNRRMTYVNPRIIKRFIDRLLKIGVLPTPKEGYHIKWGDKKEPTALEQASLAAQRMQAVSSYIQSGADVLIPPTTFLVKELGYDREEAEATLEEAAEIEEEKMAEEEAKQQEMMKLQQLQPQPPQGKQPPQGPQKGQQPPQFQKTQPNPPVVNTESKGIWRTTDDGAKIFIKDGEAHAGGPKGPNVSSDKTKTLIPNTLDHFKVMDDAANLLSKDWDPDLEALDTLLKEEKITPDDPSKPKEAFIYGAIRGWQGSSGSPVHLEIIRGALEASKKDPSEVIQKPGVENWFKNNPKAQEALRSLGKIMYETTQKYLKQEGISSVDLYRKGRTDIPFSSWSTTRGGIRHSAAGEVVSEKIPAKYILSIPQTGFGSRSEFEAVVLKGWQETKTPDQQTTNSEGPVVNFSSEKSLEELQGEDEYGSWRLVTNKEAKEAKAGGRKLDRPFRTPGKRKKFAVYTKNDKGNIVLVHFGDPNMKIKRDDPESRANFRSRHSCDDNPGPKWKARYWSCKNWSKKPVSQIVNFDPSQPRDEDGKWSESTKADKHGRIPQVLKRLSPEIENEMESALEEFAKPDSVKEFLNYSASEESVDIDDLVSPQGVNSKSGIKHFKDNPNKIESGTLPLVIQYGDKLILRDGNTRAVAAKELGRSKIRARVVYVPKLTTNKSRCWEGYKPVPGKEPFSEGSCRPVNSKKRKKKRRSNKTINSEGIWRTTEDGSKIFIKDGVAYAGGPNGPEISSGKSDQLSTQKISPSVKEFSDKLASKMKDYAEEYKKEGKLEFSKTAEQIASHLKEGNFKEADQVMSVSDLRFDLKSSYSSVKNLAFGENRPDDIQALAEKLPIGDNGVRSGVLTDIGPVEVTSYRVGAIDPKSRSNSIFFGATEGDVKAYKNNHDGHDIKKYSVKFENPVVAGHQNDLTQKWFGKTYGTLMDSYQSKYGKEGASKATAMFDKKLMDEVKKRGHDGIIYMSPAPPASTEIVIPSSNIKKSLITNQLTTNRIIKLKGNRWRVVSSEGKNFGTFGNEKAAKKRLKQVEYFKQVANFDPTQARDEDGRWVKTSTGTTSFDLGSPGKHSPQIGQKIVDLLETKTGLKYKLHGSTGKGVTSNNDWDISELPYSDEELSKLEDKARKEEEEIWAKVKSGEITKSKAFEILYEENDESVSTDSVLKELGFTPTKLSNWNGIEVVSYQNDTSGHSIDVWKPSLDQRHYTETLNAFCPTGPGGGIDNSCPPKKTGLAKDGTMGTKLSFQEKVELAHSYAQLAEASKYGVLSDPEAEMFSELKLQISLLPDNEKTKIKQIAYNYFNGTPHALEDEDLEKILNDIEKTKSTELTEKNLELAHQFADLTTGEILFGLGDEKLNKLLDVKKQIKELPSDEKEAVKEYLKTVKFKGWKGTPTEVSEILADLDSPIPTPKTKFPASIDKSEYIMTLGGSTGAKLVKIDGELYVLKKGNNAGHLRNEFAVEQLYKAMGVPVVDSKLYETSEGPVKLSKYLVEASSLGSLSKEGYNKAIEFLQKDFALDATLGNWDVIGMNLDNVMVTPDGTVYRIDVAGSLAYRAQGTQKGSSWNNENSELDTLRNNPKNPSAVKVFGTMSNGQVASSIENLIKNESKLMDALLQHASAEDMFTVKNRIAAAKAKLNEYKGTLETPKSDAASVDDLLNVALSNGGAKKLPSGFKDKLAFLNPNGIQGSTVFVPMVGGKAGSWAVSNKVAMDHLKEVMPPGTKLEGVMVNKVLKGGFKISSKTEEQAYKKALELLGLSSIPKDAPSNFFSGKSILKEYLEASNWPSTSFNAQYTLSNDKKSSFDHSFYSKQKDKLLKSELKAIDNWTGSYSSEIRKAVIDSQKTSYVSESEDAVRARNFMSGLNKLAPFTGIVHRGLVYDKYAEEQIQHIKNTGVGGIWTDDAPHSTSRVSNIPLKRARNGGLLLTIKTKTGKSVEDMSNYPYELEVVGMPKTKYRILGIHEKPIITYEDNGVSLEKVKPALHVELEEI